MTTQFEHVEVRRGRPEDWAALRTIRLQALQDEPLAYGSTHEEMATLRDDSWREQAATRLFVLAWLDGEPVGMAGGGDNGRHPDSSWLYGMFVAPTVRGGDVGPRLIGEVEAWAAARGHHALYLHVTTSLARSRAFYRKVGFVDTDETITMDRDPSIELVTMRKDLA